MRTFKYIAVIATVLTMSGAASAQTAFSPQMAQMAQSPMVQQIMKSPMARQIIAKFMTAAMTSKGSSFMKPPFGGGFSGDFGGGFKGMGQFPSMTPPAGGFGLPSFGASAPMGQW
jgi:hypothetical protein